MRTSHLIPVEGCTTVGCETCERPACRVCEKNGATAKDGLCDFCRERYWELRSEMEPMPGDHHAEVM